MTEVDFAPFDERQAALGRLLFYDPVLSGNRNISCGTCHHHDHFSADGLSLGVGEGGAGVGPQRSAGSGSGRIQARMPRNTIGLFNIGATEVRHLFLDGRVSASDLYGNGFDTPVEEYLPGGFSSLLAAASVLPFTNSVEMAGNPGENEMAGAAKDRLDQVWPVIEERVRDVPAYPGLFAEAFDDIGQAGDIAITHIGNALAAFISSEWRSFDSRYDMYLAGEIALRDDEQRGMALFFGKAGCAGCHSGKFFTDQGFHALGLPQFGPGRTRPFDPNARDVGRMGETDRLADAYRFRTPALRNVALTGPYGHDGAYATLEGILRHHLAPHASLAAWIPAQAVMPEAGWLAAEDFATLDDRLEMSRIERAIEIEPIALSDGEIEALIAFLNALTGSDSVNGRLGRPENVPSSLPLD